MANAIDNNPDVITTEHAVLIPPVPGANSILSYVEAVATVIGSCHIHSVYEDQDFVKIYLNDKKFVDFLVNTGITVLGQRVNVDYAVPRADKVTLKNIDPIIPDSILMRFLCYYGTPVSTIIHEKLASNLQYSHIECGVRKIYMNIFKDKKPPSKVSIQYQNVTYRFDMLIERFDKNIMEVDSSTTEEGNEEDTADDMPEIESVETGKPNVEEIALNDEGPVRARTRSLKSPSPARVTYRGRGRNRKNGENSITFAARKIKSRAAKGWYKNRITKVKSKIVAPKGVANFSAPKVISPVRGGRRGGRGGFSRGRGRGSYSKSFATSTPSVQEVETAGVAENEEMENTAKSDGELSPVSNPGSSKRSTSGAITQYPLTTEEIKKLMFQTRCHRAPLQVAQEFLVRKNAPEAFDDLLKQLLEYHSVVKVQSLRIRIRRLVKTLQSAKDQSV